MPKDKVGKESVDKKPKFSIQALTAAATQIGSGSKASEKRAQKERDRLQAVADRRQSLSETTAGRKILKQEGKAERDKKAKEERRESADQLGLGRDAQREPKGKNKENMQKQNAEFVLKRLENSPKGPATRNAARKMLKAIKDGPVVGVDANGRNIRNAGAGSTYLGDAGKAAVVKKLEELAGKTYSGGNKQRTGTFRDRAEAPNTIRPKGVRARRDYVKARSDVDVTKSKRSRFSQVKKNPVGRPKGSKNKPKNPPTA